MEKNLLATTSMHSTTHRGSYGFCGGMKYGWNLSRKIFKNKRWAFGPSFYLCGWGESNSRPLLGRQLLYHLTTPAWIYFPERAEEYIKTLFDVQHVEICRKRCIISGFKDALVVECKINIVTTVFAKIWVKIVCITTLSMNMHPWWNGYHNGLRNRRSRFESW